MNYNRILPGLLMNKLYYKRILVLYFISPDEIIISLDEIITISFDEIILISLDEIIFISLNEIEFIQNPVKWANF